MPASGEFRLSITKALADQLAEGLAALTPDPLEPRYLSAVQSKPGVYQLYEDDILVYVGKAQDTEPLPKRLRQHHDKLGGRLYVGRMTFTCLYVHEDMHAVSPEQLLITKYRAEKTARWNFMGFGSKDPGKERDTTKVDADHFDATHPINLEVKCEQIKAGPYKASNLLKYIKSDLPFLFRYEKSYIHEKIRVDVPRDAMSADDLFGLIAPRISDVNDAWRITALPGYVIMYPKDGPYPHALKTYR
ncbi:GIY-YIG nuclease family protein [Amycolatopsis coloradensis]|uniref:GIY-YIG nuclease family protein n=1 Tax=Amycolatopsis coloradensis TaxID=76021 RepID=UPI0011775481|nr:GIY-YIG nuclease family protein [Amycolatopsis coloradensis]